MLALQPHSSALAKDGRIESSRSVAKLVTRDARRIRNCKCSASSPNATTDSASVSRRAGLLAAGGVLLLSAAGGWGALNRHLITA